MRGLIIIIVLTVATIAGAQAIRTGGAIFSGGTLTSGLELDETNTTCATTPALTWDTDENMGLQRSAADTLKVCADGADALTINGTGITFPTSGDTISWPGGSMSYSSGSAGFLFGTTIYFAGSNGCTIGTAGYSCYSGSHAVSVRQTQSSIVSVGVSGYADAAGEVAVRVGTNRTDAESGDLATLLSVVTDEDGTPVEKYRITGKAHHTSTGAAPGDYTSGTCTSETGTGDDYSGSITATCTAGQTAIVSFNTAYTAAPICVCSAANAAAAAAVGGASGLHCEAGTGSLTVTAAAAMTAGKINFICVE